MSAMEYGVKTNGLTNFSNSSNLTPAHMNIAATTWNEIHFIGSVVSILISILGILGNILSFRVLSHCKPKCSYIFILQALAMADTLAVFSALLKHIQVAPLYYTHQDHMDYNAQVFHVCISTSENWGGVVSNWLLVILSMDRFLFASNPILEAKWFKIPRLKLAIALVVVSSFLLSALPPAVVQLTSYEPKQTVMAACTSLYFLPIFILLAFNARLMCIIKKARRYAANTSSSERNSQKRSLVINLIVIVVIFLVCATSRLAYLAFHEYVWDGAHPDIKTMAILNVATDVLVIFNHATNVLVYFFFYRRFRVMLKAMCCKRNR